ncbi:DUF3006 domain-containing protein [Patescibacteria group bacterium]|nr:DUF3006 domain-containing protein [Patescibacteria group bacterium]MBU0964057.1 DUF3006 domain-containing protein [Patescibacteria group bacterium]
MIVPHREHQLKVRVAKFEGKFAVLETNDKHEFRWPIKNLPDDVEEGADIRVKISTAKTESEERERLAQAVINKILSE